MPFLMRVALGHEIVAFAKFSLLSVWAE